MLVRTNLKKEKKWDKSKKRSSKKVNPSHKKKRKLQSKLYQSKK